MHFKGSHVNFKFVFLYFRYTTLIDKDKDGPEYTEIHNYNPQITENFVFMILTTNDNLPDNVKSKTITVTVS